MLVGSVALISCGVLLHGCGNARLDEFPTDDSEVDRRAQMIDGAYETGTITNAEYPKNWYDSEQEARA
eukprot:CAMPEP_0117496378 /NCGR_PEP_ID=MMETSP0784-20121206/20624_1 /TAXON_ID=39447 /ORGANISM="" /LENGTH=67 /DNA_ID=CAMNT_0005291343 /DNA_START=78 /DNA_END=278 /DNA_ORIENTATION=+